VHTPSDDIVTPDNSHNRFVFPPDKADEEIIFLDHSQQYCVCVIDMVNSTETVVKISTPEKIRRYYSIFINTMAFLVKKYGAKIIKNVGDGLIFYFPQTVNSTDSDAFQKVIECCLKTISTRQTINKKAHEEKLPSYNYRVSADYGKVEIAKSKTSQTDFFGSTINICAKINSMAQPNSIVIGNDLFQIVKSFSFFNKYHFKEIGGYSFGHRNIYPLYSIADKNRNNDNACKERKNIYLLVDKEFTANIMIVDDEQDILYTCKSLLSDKGYNVQTFQDPHEALNHFAQLLNSSYYHLVLLDIRMPILNGLQLFHKLKAINPFVKIMFMTALDAAEELVSILPGVKNDDIIRKPLTKESFLNKISGALVN